MMRYVPLAAIAATLLFGPAAQAQQSAPATAATPWYGELGYTWLDFRDNSIGFRAKPQAIRGVLGYNFHPNFAGEAMLMGGTSSDADRGVNVKLKNAYGLFLKPRVEMNNFELFGRLGWARENARVSALGISATGHDDDFAWGLGANYNINSRTYVGLDYMRMLDKGSSKIDGWTLGVGYRF